MEHEKMRGENAKVATTPKRYENSTLCRVKMAQAQR